MSERQTEETKKIADRMPKKRDVVNITYSHNGADFKR